MFIVNDIKTDSRTLGAVTMESRISPGKLLSLISDQNMSVRSADAVGRAHHA
jgi:hypothetical protein